MGKRKTTTVPVGQVFGYYTVLGYSHAERKVTYTPHRWLDYWHVRCKCGAERIVEANSMLSGHNRSCGCLIKDTAHRVHGMYKSPTYGCWHAMITRCTKPWCDAYVIYGAKGITVCDRWMEFSNFLADMGERPSPKHSIDRYPDQSGNYEPGNCRWATQAQQMSNYRLNLFIEYEGERLILREWARRKNINAGTLWTRIYRYGWDLDRAMTQPVRGMS